MALLCGVGSEPAPDLSNLNPSERQAALAQWLQKKITNEYAKGLLAALANVQPADRLKRVRDAAAEAGLKDCKPIFGAASTVIAGIEVTDVAGLETGTDLLDQEAPVIALSKQALLFEGQAIVTITDGVIDPSQRDPSGRIFRLHEVIAAHAKAEGIDGVTLVADPATPYSLVRDAIDAAKAAGAKRYALAGVANRELRSVPFELPLSQPPPGDLGIVVGVSRAEIVISSISGRVGTVANPRLRVPLTPRIERMAALRKALGEIHGEVPPEASRRIVLVADPALEIRDLTEVIAACRAGATGVLFGDVVLSTGKDVATAITVTAGSGDPNTTNTGSATPPPPPAVAMIEVKMAKDPGDVIPDANMVVDKINVDYVESLRQCYVDAVAIDRAFAVPIELIFTVDPNGMIIATGTVGDHGVLGECLQEKAKRWRFSKARDGKTHQPTQIRFAIKLTPKLA
jgi:hypothetical protein